MVMQKKKKAVILQNLISETNLLQKSYLELCYILFMTA